MKKFNVAFFMLFLFAVNGKTLMAQEWLIFKIYETGDLNSKLPFFDDYFYSEIAYARTERNTELFEFNGHVKMIEQKVVRDSVNFVPNENLIWHFNENGNLVKFMKGDLNDFPGWQFEEFEYDEADHLVKRKAGKDNYGNFNYSWYTYDIRGYLTERIDSFSSYDGVYYSQALFGYEDDYTKLKLEFFPLNEKELFWSFENGNYEIDYDEQGRYISAGRTVDYDKYGRPIGYFINNGCGSNSALCIQVNTNYDENGNVIEQTVHDMTTRNSLWSFSSHYKAQYNEKNLIIQKEVFPVDDFYYGSLFASNQNSDEDAKIQSSVYTYEYVFDEKGNWISQTIFLDGVFQEKIERTILYY